MRYYELQRMEFITEHIVSHGVINRADIIERFGVSVPQAGRDLSKWRAMYPGKLTYNLRAKRYEYVTGDGL